MQGREGSQQQELQPASHSKETESKESGMVELSSLFHLQSSDPAQLR